MKTIPPSLSLDKNVVSKHPHQLPTTANHHEPPPTPNNLCHPATLHNNSITLTKLQPRTFIYTPHSPLYTFI